MVHWWAAIFFCLALVTSALLLLNVEGEGMPSPQNNIYPFHSLGNAGEPPHNATPRLWKVHR